jgi:hypothetical protein
VGIVEIGKVNFVSEIGQLSGPCSVGQVSDPSSFGPSVTLIPLVFV